MEVVGNNQYFENGTKDEADSVRGGLQDGRTYTGSGQTTRSLPEKGRESIPAKPGAARGIGVVRTMGSGAKIRGQLGR